MDLRNLLLSMTDEELCGQLLCYDVGKDDDFEETISFFRRVRPGGIYMAGVEEETIRRYTDAINSFVKIPVIVAADAENGPGCDFEGKQLLPHPMAWGACNDENLIENAGRAVARECRKMGIHWTFSPVIDINMNADNPLVNIRAISDDAEKVARLSSAYVRGLQSEGLVVACCKHFPGDGTDSRNQHFVTSVNGLSADEWDSTFGKVYRSVIAESTASVMVAHIACPAYQSKTDSFFGAEPAVLSEDLKVGLLKGKLGFDGCVVSDAMSMIGSCSRCPLDELAVRFVQTGGDMVLFPDKEDYDRLLDGVRKGKISRERLLDAVERVIRLKERARLFEDQRQIERLIGKSNISEISQKIADRSICIERNCNGILPLRIPQGQKVLFVNLFYENARRREDDRMETMRLEMIRRGFEVEVINNPKHYAVKETMRDAYAVFLNIDYTPLNCNGGSLRMGWTQMMALWRGYILEHPRLVVTSFGDPYKLFEMPYLKTYLNAFSYSPSSQVAAVKLILGEIESNAKSPVSSDRASLIMKN